MKFLSCAMILVLSASSAAQSWTPDPNDPSLLMWLSADYGFAVTTEGEGEAAATTVSWTSKATASSAAGVDGIVFTQTNPVYSPALNPSTYDPTGFQSVTFDGSDYLASPYIAPNPETGRWDLDPANPLVGQQTAFIVYRNGATRPYSTPLGTFYDGKGSYHGNVDASSLFTTYTDPATTQGAIYRNGTRMDDSDPWTEDFGPPRPSDWVVDAYVAIAPLPQGVTTIGSDSCNNLSTTNFSAARGITGEITEILLFNRELDPTELDRIGTYLSRKYQIPTAYPDAPTAGPEFLANSFLDFSDVQGANNWSYGYGYGAAFTSFDMTHETAPADLPGAGGAHFYRLNEDDPSGYSVYPKIWNSGQHPETSRSATRRWAAEAAGWLKVTGHVAKYHVDAATDGVLGEVYAGEERRFAQDIGPMDGQGKAFTTYVRVSAVGDSVDFSVGAKGALNCDSTRYTAVVEAIDQDADVYDLAADFAGVQTTGQNPNGAWSYFEIDADGTEFPYWADGAIGNDDPSFIGWGSGDYSLIRKNVSGTAQTMFTYDVTPANAVALHPGGPGEAVGVAWMAPSDGTVDIAGFAALLDLATGAGGVDWVLSLLPAGTIEPTELAAGNLRADNSLESGDDVLWVPYADSFGLESVRVQAGDAFRLVIFAGDTHSHDLTQASMTVLFSSSGTIPLAGDLNGDGMVGSADLDIVRANWGQTVEAGCLSCGDPSGDGVVGSPDLDIVRANWGASTAAAVPEPSWLIPWLAGVAFLMRRR